MNPKGATRGEGRGKPYQGTCFYCDEPGHRYGSTDPDHEPTMVACINGLRHKLELAEKALRQVATADYRGPMPEAVGVALKYFTATRQAPGGSV